MPRMANDLYSRIRARLDELGLTEREASIAAAGNGELIRNIKRGRSENLRGPRLLKLAKVLRVEPEWLSGENDHISSEQIANSLGREVGRESNGAAAAVRYASEIPGAVPEIDARAGAGHGTVGDSEVVAVGPGHAIMGHRVTAEWLFPAPFLRHELRIQPGGIMVLEVVGDSMSPTLESGDRVIIDASHTRPVPDGIYLIDEGDGPMVKRLQVMRRSDPPEIRVISDNPRHEPYTLRVADIRVIGRVSGRITKM